MRAVRAGAIYFLIVFAAGFVLGTVRVLAIVPRLGERAAELAEIPVMVCISFLAARAVVGWFRLGTAGARVAAGVIALGLLVAAELGVVHWVRGETLAQYVAARDPLAGSAYLASLLLFAAMPLLVRRGG